MITILILGARGMLGQELVRAYKGDAHVELIAWDKDDIDVTDIDVLKARVAEVKPDVIYNAIAYNAVDAAEGEGYDDAVMLNATFPGKLSEIAAELDATIVHYSTDYVFSGEKESDVAERPEGCCGGGCCGAGEQSDGYRIYNEHDAPEPVSKYGETKLAGERAVAVAAPDRHYIIRLSKLFGQPAASAAGKKSFFDVMLTKGCEESKVMAVDGECSKFTYARDLAQESKAIVEEGCDAGIYHIVNEGAATWYEGVLALYKIAGVETAVESVSPDIFERAAKRPDSSVLANTKRPPLRHYEDALREYLSEKE